MMRLQHGDKSSHFLPLKHRECVAECCETTPCSTVNLIPLLRWEKMNTTLLGILLMPKYKHMFEPQKCIRLKLLLAEILFILPGLFHAVATFEKRSRKQPHPFSTHCLSHLTSPAPPPRLDLCLLSITYLHLWRTTRCSKATISSQSPTSHTN